jgi:hypothetical protein
MSALRGTEFIVGQGRVIANSFLLDLIAIPEGKKPTSPTSVN